MRVVLLVVVLGLVHLDVASAQARPMPPYALQRPRAESVDLSLQAAADAQRSTANSVFIAGAGSVLGAVAGGFLGYTIDRARDVPSEDPGLGGLIIGGFAGSAIGAPTLLYVANDRRGPVGRAILFSVAGTAAGAAAFWNAGPFIYVVPAIQVGISVAILN